MTSSPASASIDGEAGEPARRALTALSGRDA